MLTAEQQQAIVRFIRLGGIWKRGPRRTLLAVPATTAPADPYADLTEVYNEITEHEPLDMGVPVDRILTGADVDEVLSFADRWYGFHEVGDHHYE